MSFGGGGGVVGVTAHKHTNAAGEGGGLDNTTIMQDMPLSNFVLVMG